MPEYNITIEFIPHPPVNNFRDLTDLQFGRLTVLGYAGANASRLGQWWCKCPCGTVRIFVGRNLVRGDTQSCGCLRTELLPTYQRTHGETSKHVSSPEYISYASARDRCTNVNIANFLDYGGRGIEFRFNSFEEFLATVGRRPTALHSLDRIDNDGHYEPGNVKWSTKEEQAQNRRSNVNLTLNGKTQCLTRWATEMNVGRWRLSGRRKRGWCDVCILTIPRRGGNCTHNPNPKNSSSTQSCHEEL